MFNPWLNLSAKARAGLVGALLGAATLWAYWPATGFDFINFDDPLYVTANPHVQAGLTGEGLAWAFGRVHGQETYWHPLTWVSHMVDCQLYGLKPWGHHLTSVLLHAANAVLVLLLFRRMTGAFWRCVVLAALFALHPLQVDSVAWVAERKTLVSAFFWLLTTLAYVRYVECGVRSAECGMRNAEASPTPHAPRTTSPTLHPSIHLSILHPPSSIFYLLSLLCFALGLMSKPVLVTLPCVLLLLDYWPLGRMRSAARGLANAEGGKLEKEPRMEHGWNTDEGREKAGSEAPSEEAGDTHHAPRTTPPPSLHQSTNPSIHQSITPLLRLALEKIPFFVLAAASSIITLLAHRGLGILDTVDKLPLGARMDNALVSYVRYLGKVVWPSGLSIIYPYPAAWPTGQVIACALLLLAVCGLVLCSARKRPWLFVGWFWFLGVLVPFIGLVQAGVQAMADRFMYVPIIGIIVAVVWGLHGLATGGRRRRVALFGAGCAAAVLCLVLTRQQLAYWQGAEPLFRHALEVTENNYLAHNNLSEALGNKGQWDEVVRHSREAIRLRPDFPEAYNNLGSALTRQGRIDEAIRAFQEALRLNPNHADAHNNLGTALDARGQADEAMSQFQEALRLNPNHADAHNNLGIALAKRGRVDEAIGQFGEAIRLKPDDALARSNLGNALAASGRLDEAIGQYQEAIRLQPDYASARNNLGNALAGIGRLDEAIRQFQEAIRLQPDYAKACNNLGIALGRTGRLDEAIRAFQEALRLQPDYADARKNLDLMLAARQRASEEPR